MLRHTVPVYLSLPRNAGIPLCHIQEISGHRTLAARERYLGVTEKQKQNAISALDF
ncbi:integrase [Nostoc sp. CHAB 5784]|uniref:integrase n=1 Tax=Nostoc mirabile TaxID=2907820 RepID=UPI001E423CBA|nr:integrase [Nostoc mirabile]MCC5668017.1 integrase [Nostoc mirabile CHAB5784]